MADVETTIRISADTKMAVEQMTAMTVAMEKAGTKAAPRFTGGLGKANAVMGTAEARAALLSGRLIGLPSAIGSVTSAFAAMAPELAIIVTAIALISDGISKNRKEMEAWAKTVDLNVEALNSLALANGEVGEAARQRSKDEYDAAKAQVATLQATYTTVVASLEQQKRAYVSEFGESEEAVKGFERAQKGLINSQRTIEASLSAALKIIADFEKPAKEAAKAATALSEAQSKLFNASQEASGRLIAEGLRNQAENAQKLLDIEVARANVRAGTAGQGGDVFSIIEASNAVIAAEQIAYENRLNNANAFDGSRQVIEAQFTLFLETELAKRNEAVRRSLDAQEKATKKTKTIEKSEVLKTYEQIGKASAANAAQLLLIQHATLRETIQAVGDSARAQLAAEAVVWLAEGIAASFTNPALAAQKFRAAAYAGAGAVAISGIVSAFGAQDERNAAASEVASLGGGGSSSKSSGRTLVSQGPVTLYYSATMVINGHVFDKTDIYNEFSLWNMEQLRRAGADAGQRAT
jgi:hypothetical protein